MLYHQEVLDIVVKLNAASGTTIGSQKRRSSSAGSRWPQRSPMWCRNHKYSGMLTSAYNHNTTRIAQSTGPVFPFAMVTTVVTSASARFVFVRTGHQSGQNGRPATLERDSGKRQVRFTDIKHLGSSFRAAAAAP